MNEKSLAIKISFRGGENKNDKTDYHNMSHESLLLAKMDTADPIIRVKKFREPSI